MLERLERHGVSPEQAAGAVEGNFLTICGPERPRRPLPQRPADLILPAAETAPGRRVLPLRQPRDRQFSPCQFRFLRCPGPSRLRFPTAGRRTCSTRARIRAPRPSSRARSALRRRAGPRSPRTRRPSARHRGRARTAPTSLRALPRTCYHLRNFSHCPLRSPGVPRITIMITRTDGNGEAPFGARRETIQEAALCAPTE